MRCAITIVTGLNMKVLTGLLLVAAIALVQGRSAIVKNAGVRASYGEHPHHVHLRFALSNGLLGTCDGVLIDHRWVLTTAGCLDNATFIWVRYGTISVPNPELVTETSAVTRHPDRDGLINDIALISLNRNVEYTEGIQGVAPETSSRAEHSVNGQSATLCSWGSSEELACSDLLMNDNVCLVPGNPDNYVCGESSSIDSVNVGTPLIMDDYLVGLLSYSNSDPLYGFAAFTRVGKYVSWIESVTGLTFDDSDGPEEVDVAPPPQL